MISSVKGSKIEKEASAFDKQILERVSNGHIPDLRRVKFCKYFYNNPWRDPGYVKIVFGEEYEMVNKAIKQYSSKNKGVKSILEVGCGPGYLSLELARAGHNVMGIDVSGQCIKVANHFANTDPWSKKRGALIYIQRDFFDPAWVGGQGYDAIIFSGSLHHFKDQNKVMKKAKKMLKSKGIIIAHEPTRDRVTESSVAVVHMFKLLLSLSGKYFQKSSIPPSFKQGKAQIKKVMQDLKYENAKGHKIQSVNDNEAGFLSMSQALRKNFKQVYFLEQFAFFQNFIGGLRFKRSVNNALAIYLRDMDRYLCQLGVLQPTEFFFVGKNK